MKIKKFSCQFDDTIEVYFLLGINIWGLRSEWVNVKGSGKQWYFPLTSNLERGCGYVPFGRP